jgi:hypothetical protein
MPTINRVVWGEVGDGLAAAKSDLVGEREVMEVTEIQVILVLILYTIPPTTGKREIVVVVIGPYSMTPLHTRPEKTDPSCEQGRSGRPYDARSSVTGSQLDRSLRARRPAARSPAPSLGSRPLSPHSPLPSPRISPAKTWLGISGRADDGAQKESVSLSGYPMQLGVYQLINYLSGISSPARSIHPSIIVRKSRVRGGHRGSGGNSNSQIMPATTIPTTGSCSCLTMSCSHLVAICDL